MHLSETLTKSLILFEFWVVSRTNKLVETILFFSGKCRSTTPSKTTHHQIISQLTQWLNNDNSIITLSLTVSCWKLGTKWYFFLSGTHILSKHVWYFLLYIRWKGFWKGNMLSLMTGLDKCCFRGRKLTLSNKCWCIRNWPCCCIYI